MKLIKSNYKILEQSPGLGGIYKLIEIAGRTCYKSEDKISENSAKEFADRMIKSGHGSMLEHGTVYLKSYHWKENRIDFPQKYHYNKYSKMYSDNTITYATGRTNDKDADYITTNLRVLVENNWLDDLQYLCEPTEYHERRVTVNFDAISRVQGESFLRHRVFSFARQSTRYCNYSKTEKFGNHLQFIRPYWTNIPLGEYEENEEFTVLCPENIDYYSLPLKERCFISSMMDSEADYLLMTTDGCKPQEAREVLPLSLNSPLIMTGFVSDWKHFFSLRCSFMASTGKPHPDAALLADPLYNEFKELKLI